MLIPILVEPISSGSLSIHAGSDKHTALVQGCNYAIISSIQVPMQYGKGTQ